MYAVPEPVEVVAGGGRAGRSDLASAMFASRSTHGCRGGRCLVVEEWEELLRKLHVSELDKASSVTKGAIGWAWVAAAGIAVYGNCPPDADRTRLIRRSKARQISRLGNAIMSCHAISTPSALTTIINSKLYADQHVIRCKNTYTPSDVIGGLRRRHHCFNFYPQSGPALESDGQNPTLTLLYANAAST